MKKIITKDNTETFVDPKTKQSYHSITGAVEEALKKYSEPCKIKELAKSGDIKILDACFGLGYNSAMAISVALEVNPNCKIEVIGLENDPKIIKKIQEVNPPIKSYIKYKKISEQVTEVVQDNIKIKLIIGDMRHTIKNLQDNYFDAVFFDPFSPKVSPELWTKEIFEEMYRIMKDTAILSTYSCARIVRENIKSAGFNYDDGPKVGRRGPGTIAFKSISFS